MRVVRKLLPTVLACVLLFGVTAPYTVYADEITVIINDQPLELTGQAPTIVDGQAFVPIRPVFEAIGFDVNWSEHTGSAIIRRDNWIIRITPGSYIFIENGINYSLEVPAQNIGGSLMMPARAVLERADHDLHWDEDTRTLTVEATDFRSLAEMGDAHAQSRLARSYHITGDDAQGLYWHRRAADQGWLASQSALGALYLLGIGTEQDFDQAGYRLSIALEQDTPGAQVNTGLMYYMGWGVAQDFERAMYWFRLSAEQGYAMAYNNIGVMYRDGNGTARDYVQAAYWFERGAELGNVLAALSLGVMYAGGQGMEQDYERAVYWFRTAAELGSASAQNNLGVMYQNGNGVTQSYQQASYWFWRAIDQGYANALLNLADLPPQYILGS